MSPTGDPIAFLFGVINLLISTPVSIKNDLYISSFEALPLPVANFFTVVGGTISRGFPAFHNLYFNTPVFSAIWNTRPVALKA